MNQRVSKVKNFKKKMKINEKSLIHFANSKRSSDKEGYLQKKGELNKSFHRRWFVLKGNLLFYYDKKHDKEPVGVVVLEGCTIELAAAHHINNCSGANGSSSANGGAMAGESFTFEIVFPRSGARTYVLSANSQEEMESWMKALTCASYDYLKMMVTELQRQLEEANHDQTQKFMAQGWENSSAINCQASSHTSISGDSNSLSSPPSWDKNLYKNNISGSLSSNGSSHRLDSGCDMFSLSKDSCDPSECESNYRYPSGLQNRFNPFNSLDSDGEMISPVSTKETTNSHSYSSDSLQSQDVSLDFTNGKNHQRPAKPRNFLEMHEEFGRLCMNISQTKGDEIK